MSEPKKYTLAEFIAQAKADLDDYQKDWEGPIHTNEWHQGSHTWVEWYASQRGYFSWEER